ncbi:MAG: radical SAM protein [Thermoplasmatales archaeon]|nr:radical SAM protein [Thermoplasmatales archaeon]
MRIRASPATADFLGLKKLRIDAPQKTLYFLMDGICEGNCSYCGQKNGKLGRMYWESYGFNYLKEKMEKKAKKAKRICIQTIYGEKYWKDLLCILKEFSKYEAPTSVSINAIGEEKMLVLKENGVERVGIGLDCFTEEIFNKFKKNVPSWKEYLFSLRNAKRIFGNATCHLIVGLGENDKEVIDLFKKLSEMKIKIALFPYSKGNETVVSLERYRAIQLSIFAIEKNKGKIYFNGEKISSIELCSFPKNAFSTLGCPDCNRPFYNDRVKKIYNYPYKISEKELVKCIEEAEKYARIYIADK